jgi:hypothetical protein
MKKFIVKAFVSKFILYIYQNTKWIKEKLPPKYTPPKN